jgi:hypothetical protein
VSIYEAIGIGYAFIATTVFTAQLIYLGIKGLAYIQRLILRGQAEENLDLQRSESIKRELAEVE